MGAEYLGSVWLVLIAIMTIDRAILAGKNKERVQQASTKRCPYCAELIQQEANSLLSIPSPTQADGRVAIFPVKPTHGR